jgi:Tfp pilus assembly protein PilF
VFLREPLLLLWLALGAILFFAVTHELVRFSDQRRHALGETWAQRGRAELAAGHAALAITHLRNALLYAPSDAGYRLSLAEALAATGRVEEAEPYLQNLWQDQPADGRINLDLAQIATRRQDTRSALRYYHGAIYGIWGDDNVAQRRREARIELISFLLRQKYLALARSELIALEPDMPPDPAFATRVALWFGQAGDASSGLRVYEKALQLAPGDHDALVGAGDSAFQMGRYALARHYFEQAAAAYRSDLVSGMRARVSGLLLDMNPYQTGLSERERAGRALAAFEGAGKLLVDCRVADELPARWKKLRRGLTAAKIERDPQLYEGVMQFVDTAAQATPADCAADPELRTTLQVISRTGAGK